MKEKEVRRRASKTLGSGPDSKVKIMGMDLSGIQQDDCEVSLIVEDDGVFVRFDVDTESKKINIRYQEGPQFTQKSYTTRQLIEYIKKDKRK